MRLLYRAGTSAILQSMSILAGVSKKVRHLLHIRKVSMASLHKFRHDNPEALVWVHCASLGEYEQVVPLLRMINQKHPNKHIAVTFFSPSGFENMDNYGIVDWKGYLPFDRYKDVRKFIDLLQPEIAVFVKNELWWNTLDILHQMHIPYHLVYSTLHTKHYAFKSPNRFMRKLLSHAASIGVMGQEARNFLTTTFPYTDIYENTDGRVLKAQENANTSYSISSLERYPRRIFIYGSVYIEDVDQLLDHTLERNDILHILLPHHLNDDYLDKLKQRLPQSRIITNLEDISPKDHIVIINKMGILKFIYRYADAAYVGGAYNDGLHNIIEAAVYNTPIAIGEVDKLLPLDQDLINKNVVTRVQNQKEFQAFIESKDRMITFAHYWGDRKNDLEQIFSKLWQEEK